MEPVKGIKTTLKPVEPFAYKNTNLVVTICAGIKPVNISTANC
jgi:hypothetical protein